MTQILAILLMALPAFPILALSLVPEYWGKIYFWWGAAFAVLGWATTSFCVGRTRRHGKIPSEGELFLAGMVAWCLSLIALVWINITPLCQGQDSGDGTNDLGMCLFLTVFWAIFMSLPVVLLVYLSSRITRTMLGTLDGR